MFRIQANRWIIPAVAIVGLTWAYAGRAQEPRPGQKKSGEKVDNAIQDVKGGLRRRETRRRSNSPGPGPRSTTWGSSRRTTAGFTGTRPLTMP